LLLITVHFNNTSTQAWFLTQWGVGHHHFWTLLTGYSEIVWLADQQLPFENYDSGLAASVYW